MMTKVQVMPQALSQKPILVPATFHTPLAHNPWECEQAFRKAMHQAGIVFNGEIMSDGVIHRFPSGNKSQKDGWYVFYGMAGAFGDWSRDINEKWALNKEVLPYQGKEKLREQLRSAQHMVEEERLRKHEETATLAMNKWNALSETGQSTYLEKKHVDGFGVRFSKGFLIIPLKDTTGKLWSLQWIGTDGTKRFLPGGRKKGCFHHIGVLEDGKPIIIAEGYATGASIYMATQGTVVVAFDAGNLEPVIEDLKQTYPNSPLTIARDDDCWKDTNPGREKAEEVAQKYNCSVVFPQFKNTETKPTDFNDLHVLEGLDTVKQQLEQAPQTIIPDPLPIASALLPVLPFTLEMVPEPLHNWLKDIAHRRQCPLDFVAIPAIVMIASLIGARCAIKPNMKDDWTVVPNLWGGILGDPGTLKSPICSEVLFPFGHLELKANETYHEQKSLYDAEKTTFLETKNALERQIKENIEQGNEGELHRVQEKLSALLKKSPPAPVHKRYKVSDTTVEKMQEILSQNPGGILVFRDELMGFLETWEKKGHESDRSFYLEAWNGDKPYTIDRIGRGTIHAANICVSILGTTQPDKIGAYLHKAIAKMDNDGLLQRFQLLVYPDKKPWKLVDESPDPFAKGRVFHICKTIDTLKFTDCGAQMSEPLYEGQYTIPYFRLSPEAQTFFHDWIRLLQEKLETKEHPLLIQHLSKYRSLMPSLALVFHIINVADGLVKGDIPLNSVRQAAACCAFLESHARRIYGMVLESTFDAVPTLSKADELLAWIKRQSATTGQPLKRRFILRYSKFRSSKELDPLLSDLVQMGYIQEGPVGSFGVVLQ
jgi:putative DNA primase/helicase